MNELNPNSSPELSGIMYIPNPSSSDRQRYADLYKRAQSMSKRANRFITGSFISLCSTTAYNAINNDIGSLPQALSMLALTSSYIYGIRANHMTEDLREEQISLGFTLEQQQEILEYNGIKQER